METCKVGGIDIFNPVQEKQIDEVINYMVDFYGEKYRSQIVENIKWANFLFVGKNVGSQSVTSVSVFEYYNKKYQTLAKEFYGEFGIEDLKYGYLKQDFSSLLKLLKNIEKELIRGNINDREQFKGYLLSNISCFYPLQNFFPQLSMQKKSGVFVKYSDLQSELEKANQADKVFAKNLVNFFIKDDNLSQTIELVKGMQSKYNYGYKKRVDKLAKDADGKVNFLIDKESELQDVYLNCREDIKKIIVEYFASVKKQDVSRLLKDPNIDRYCEYFIDISNKRPEFYTVHDKNNYIELALYLEIIKDVNEIDIDKMLEDEKIDAVLRNKATIKRYTDKKEEYDQIFISKNWYLKKALEKVPKEDLDYVIYNLNYFLSPTPNYVNGMAFSFSSKVNPNIKKSYCIFNQYTELSDHAFVHEINHLSNVSKYISDDKSGGLDFSNGDDAVLDEIVNEYFTCKIMDKMDKDKFSMFENKEEHPVTYSFAFPVISKFIDKHEDLFIKCKLEGDVYKFSKIIGDENFSKLNDMLDQYMELNMEYAQYKFGYENGLMKQYFDFLQYKYVEQSLELMGNKISLFLKGLESKFEKNSTEEEKYYE